MSSKLSSWHEVINVLKNAANLYIGTLDFSHMAKEADFNAIQVRKEKLAKDFSIFLRNLLEGNMSKPRRSRPVRRYVYIVDVYEDAYAFVWEYVGESEHEFGYVEHGIEAEEFPRSDRKLLKDFALYLKFAHTSQE